MSAFIVCDQATKPVSIGSLDPGSIPAGHTKVTITDAEFDAVRRGDKRVLDGGVLQDTGRAAAEANRATLEQQARDALVANRTFVAVASPTNAQTVAQVKALSRQVNAIIRTMYGVLDGTD